MKRISILIGLILIILAGCAQSSDTQGDQPEPVTPVEITNVTRGDLQKEHEIFGRAMPGDSEAVIPKTSGELIELNVEKGDAVEKGQIIGKMDPESIENQIELQEIAVAQAQTQLDNAIVSKEQAQSALENAQLQRDEAARSNEEDGNTSLAVENARIQWEQAQKNLERMEELYEAGAIPLTQLEQAQIQEQQARIAYEQAQNQAESGERSVEQAENAVTQAEQRLKQAEIGVEQARLQLQQARTQLQQTKNQLDNTAIKATISGIVTEVNGKEGGLVSNTQPLATIISLNPIKIQANVSADELPLFQKGEEVNVYIHPLDKAQKAVVTYISPVVGDNGMYTVEAELENNNQEIKPGMMASFQLPQTTVSDQLLVPTSAVVEQGDSAYVFIVENDRAVQKKITIIETQTAFTAIEGDLKPGDQVVIKGQLTLTDGNKVQIMKEDQQ